MIDNFDAIDRVAFGARLLDEVWSKWFEDIDLDNFDMSNGLRCVGAQLIASSDHDGHSYFSFENYFYQLLYSNMETHEIPLGYIAFLDACGFNICNSSSLDDEAEEYAALEIAWRDEILIRRGSPFSRERRQEFNTALTDVLEFRARLGSGQENNEHLIIDLRNATSALLTAVGHMQSDVNSMERKGAKTMSTQALNGQCGHCGESGHSTAQCPNKS